MLARRASGELVWIEELWTESSEAASQPHPLNFRQFGAALCAVQVGHGGGRVEAERAGRPWVKGQVVKCEVRAGARGQTGNPPPSHLLVVSPAGSPLLICCVWWEGEK